jgi:hypothetical protein
MVAGLSGCMEDERSENSSAVRPLESEDTSAVPLAAAVSQADDVGKACSDSSQCEGMCFSDQVDLPADTRVEGVCSGNGNHWGREIKEVVDGKLATGSSRIVM